MRRTFEVSVASLILVMVGVPKAVAGDLPVAGTDPSQRPAGAPVITTVERPGSWYGEALHGITRPYPYSLRFLEDQGNWHTPFNRPGMPGRYDIRGWHRK